jgi:hypothetical protein
MVKKGASFKKRKAFGENALLVGRKGEGLIIASSTQFPRFYRNDKFRGHNLILGQNSFFGILNPVTSPQKNSDCPRIAISVAEIRPISAI